MKKIVLIMALCGTLFASPSDLKKCTILIKELDKRYDEFMAHIYWHKLLVCEHPDYKEVRNIDCTEERYMKECEEVQRYFNDECR